ANAGARLARCRRHPSHAYEITDTIRHSETDAMNKGVPMEEMTATEVLTTTRTVRRRMDFDRPVAREVILECIEVALQAPTGGGVERWEWLVIEDAQQRLALAELYRSAALAAFEHNRDTAASEDSRRVYD